MSQNDMSVVNADGATVRADINSALQALASLSSGSSAPSTTYPYQLWMDTSNGILKQRNSANNAWVNIYKFNGTTGLQFSWRKGADIASASALTLGVDGNYFDVTGTTAITSIGTTGTIGTVIKLHFDGALTLTHHATDLILPGGENISTAAGDEAEFIEYAAGDWRCTSYTKADGTGVVGGDADVVKLAEQDASTSSSIDFTSFIDGTYSKYILEFQNVTHDGSGNPTDYLSMRLGNGGSFDSGASDYRYNLMYQISGSPAGSNDIGEDEIIVTWANMTSNANDVASGRVTLFAPSEAEFTLALVEVVQINDSGQPTIQVHGACRAEAAAHDRAQFLFRAGSNIESGHFILYGVK